MPARSARSLGPSLNAPRSTLHASPRRSIRFPSLWRPPSFLTTFPPLPSGFRPPSTRDTTSSHSASPSISPASHPAAHCACRDDLDRLSASTSEPDRRRLCLQPVPTQCLCCVCLCLASIPAPLWTQSRHLFSRPECPPAAVRLRHLSSRPPLTSTPTIESLLAASALACTPPG